MDPLQKECFYRIVARFPHELAGPSPLKSHKEPVVIGCCPEELCRVSEDTSCYQNQEIAKPRGCFLGNYDPISKIGIVFLTTTKAQAYPWRYLPVHGGRKAPLPDSLFTSKLAFLEPCWINVSHPLRVKVLYVEPQKSLKGTLRRANVDPTLTPPIVGIQYGTYHAQVNQNAVQFSSDSRERFWQAHLAYHARRNSVRTEVPTDLQSAGGSGGAGSRFYKQGQSYGFVLGKEIGVDVPLMLRSFSDSSDDESNFDETGQILDGTFHISDLSTTIFELSTDLSRRGFDITVPV